jgi:hypothetical protein
MSLKARENPFCTHRVEALLAFEPAWLGTTWEQILTDLASQRYRGAIVGPHGSGKTTFLEALVPRLNAEGFPLRHYFLNDQLSAEIAIETDPDTIVIIDGAERLGFRAWRRIRTHSRLLVTQHREGRLSTLLRTRSTAEMLENFARQLDPSLAIDARLLHRKHRGNLREALLECYDLAAPGTDLQSISMERISSPLVTTPPRSKAMPATI